MAIPIAKHTIVEKIAPNHQETRMRNILGIATAVAILTCGAAAAAPMTKEEYKANKARIAAEYTVDRQKCGSRHGNAADLCIARAHGARDASKAELAAAYKPSPRANYDAAIARAKAAYAIAKEECDNKKGEPRKVCQSEAKAAQQRAKTEAATTLRKSA
jgi:hypothetical protein